MKTTTKEDSAIDWRAVAEQMRAHARSQCWELCAMIHHGATVSEVDMLALELAALMVEAGEVEFQKRTND